MRLPSFTGAVGTSGNNLVKYSQLQTVIPSIVAITSSIAFGTSYYDYTYSYTGSTISIGTLPAIVTANRGRTYTVINNGSVPFTVNSNTGSNDIRFRGADYGSYIIQPGCQATFMMDVSKIIVYEPMGVSNSITSGDAYNAVTSGAVHAALNSKAEKTGTGDIEITDPAKGIILRSPNGNRWRTTVNDSGVLTTVLIP